MPYRDIEKGRAYARKYRAEHKEERKEYAKRYKLEHSDKLKKTKQRYYLANRERINAQIKKWRQDNREVYNKHSLKSHYKYPEQAKARAFINNAIRAGKLKRGTCHCGKVAEAHHEDYKKPFEITWLCAKHHGEYHRIIV